MVHRGFLLTTIVSLKRKIVYSKVLLSIVNSLRQKIYNSFQLSIIISMKRKIVCFLVKSAVSSHFFEQSITFLAQAFSAFFRLSLAKHLEIKQRVSGEKHPYCLFESPRRESHYLYTPLYKIYFLAIDYF